jgi:outer membrane murein-binding lipoprotein Lpp
MTLMVSTLLLAGCAGEGGFLGDTLMTSSVAEAPKVDPICVTLTSQIDTLKKDGIAEKIEKAAAKKYKMTPADMAKADQLTKANSEFQAKCSTVSPKTTTAAVAAPAPAPKPAPAVTTTNYTEADSH